MDNNVYFAAKDAPKTAAVLTEKANSWFNHMYSNGYLNKLKDMWLAYHGAYYQDAASGHKISFGGEQGELTQIAVNHLRNIGQHMLNMVTSSRPSMEARATNTDYKSLVQTKLANNLLDYYMREKRLEKFLKRAVEYSIVLGSGYIKMDWNATSGEIYDFNEETNTPIYEGDVEFSNLSPLDVYFDTTKETDDYEWVLCRTFKNKYDLAAKYPELKDKIINSASKSDIYKYRFDVVYHESTDDVPVYEFYHKRTESMPDGRYLMYLDSEIVLMDAPMPYRNLPVYRISPSIILGTPYGYTPLFDIMPIQDAVNSLYSTILTNQHAFGVQNIYIPRGADVNFKSLAGGLNLIEGNAQAGKPEALNLTQTPGEVFNFLKMLEGVTETISGVNSVIRGNPEASLKSGTALAMVQSTALQFMSGLQGEYIRLIEDVGTGLINILKDFAAVPRVAMIVGKSNKSYVMKEFTGDDLSMVNRVIVEVGNPLARTTAGKTQLAESLIQYGIVKTPEEYFTILNTGRIDPMTDGTQNELFLIRSENEKMAEGEDVQALAVDQHVLHIKEHKSVLSDPDLRKDQQLVAKVLSHIQEHIDLLRSTDANLLSIIGEQSLGPQGGSPTNQPAPQDQVNGSVENVGAVTAPPSPIGEVPNMPNMPKPPPPFENAPVTAEQAMTQKV